MQLLERRIATMREAHELDENKMRSQLLGIVFVLSGNTMFNRYYDQVIQRVAQDFKPEKIFQTRIPMDVNVARSIDTFTPVVIDNPGTAGSKAFMKLAQEFLQKL
jgi:chromosome partitioning protein